MILQIIGALILFVSTLVGLVGALGLLRLPNFFARTHGGSITDTLAATLAMLGMIIYTVGMDLTLLEQFLVIVKLTFILVFLLVSSPLSGHALTRAAYRRGLGGQGAPKTEDLASLPFGVHGPADTREILEGGKVYVPSTEKDGAQ